MFKSPTKSKFQRKKEQIAAWWARITAPTFPDATIEEAWQIRLLIAIHLFLAIAIIGFMPLLIIATRAKYQLDVVIIIGTVLVYLFGSVFFARTRHYKIIMLLTPILSAFQWGVLAAWFQDSFMWPYFLGYLVVPVILGTLFLPPKQAIHIALGNIAIIVANVLLNPYISLQEGLAGALTWYVIAAGMILVAHYFQASLAQQRQQLIAKNERRLRRFFEHAHDWIFELDANGVIRYVNQRMCDDSGYTKEELVGNTPFAFLYPEGVNAIAQPLQKILSGETVEHVEVEVPLRNGRTIWLDVKGLIEMENGQITGTIHIARDITKLKTTEQEIKARHEEIAQLYEQAQQEIAERKRAEEAEREQRLFAEGLAEAVSALHSTHNLDELMQKLTEAVNKTMSVDGLTIMFNEDGVARIAYMQGLYKITQETLSKIRFKITETHNLAVMAETGQPYTVPDTHADPDWIYIPEVVWIRSTMGAPIIYEDELLGFLSLESKTPNYFTENDKKKVAAFAKQVAVAINDARIYQALADANERLEKAVQERTAELERSIKQIRAILQNSPDGVALLNKNGFIENCNPAFFALFPQAESDSSLSLVQLIEQPEEIATAIEQTLKHGRFSRLESIIHSPQGSPIDLDIALAPVIDQNEIIGAVCSIRDISAMKEVSRMKDKFISNVSHELRTPLTNLRLHHDLIRHNPAKQDVYLERMGREILRLQYIIESMLRLSRLDRKGVAFTPHPTKLDTLVTQYVQDRTPLFEEKELSVSCETAPSLPLVSLDEGLIGQVLSILLTNAINFTPQNGRIQVSVRQMAHNGRSGAAVTIQDTGPGVPPEEQTHIFERFYRGKIGQSSGIPGTGLGLAIAREIMQLHKGDIWVESEGVPGKGAAFTIWLPLSETEGQHS
jgi:two-component system phosphate regulon sensor histidine kinase PhoR